MFATWQVGEVIWSLLWITLVFLWIMLVVRVFADIFRSDDLGGFAKVLWILFVILTPYLGVFVYLIARGRDMTIRDQKAAQEQEAAFRTYVRSAAGAPTSPVAELERLSALRDSGTIDDTEFTRLKRDLLG